VAQIFQDRAINASGSIALTGATGFEHQKARLEVAAIGRQRQRCGVLWQATRGYWIEYADC
jgi:hypothetical protein